MAKYRSVQTGFWSDSKVVDDFTPEDRYFYLYLLTNEKSNQLGCYELSIRQMCRDTGYNEETIKKLLNRFENVLKIINFDENTKEIFIKNWYKYNWLNSESTKTCIEKELGLVKSGFLRELIDPLYAPYMPPGGNKKKKKKKKNNKNNERENIKEREFSDVAIATTPSLSEISSYGASLGIGQDYCEDFYNHYEGIGWINGSGQEIKNWKAIFNYWVKKDRKEGKIKENKRYF